MTLMAKLILCIMLVCQSTAKNFEIPVHNEQVFMLQPNNYTAVSLMAGGDYSKLETLAINNQRLNKTAIESLIDDLKDLPIKRLNLGSNEFEGTFDVGRLQKLKSLKYFKISTNMITKIASSVQKEDADAPSIVELTFYFNQLTSIDFKVFKAFTNLNELTLSHNQIKGVLDIGQLQPLKSLSLIYVDGNQIANIINSATTDMPPVTKMSFSNNKITGVFDIGCLQLFKELSEFYINENQITSIKNTATANIPSIIKINLNDNQIGGAFDIGNLKLLTGLLELYVHQNEITSIVDSNTKDMPSITLIDFSYNKLRVLDLANFAKLINLKKILLNQNLLMSIAGYDKAQNILPKIESITLNGNEFECSDLERMVAPFHQDFWYTEYDGDETCTEPKRGYFRNLSCCYTTTEIHKIMN